MNAPRSWPKSSDSTRVGGAVVQSKTTNGACARGPSSWSASASTSLPVPVSPSMMTGTLARRAARRADRAAASRGCAEHATEATRRSGRRRAVRVGLEIDRERRRPTRTISPPSSSASTTRTRSTKVPLVEPRSVTRMPPATISSAACRRETSRSVSRSSHAGLCPTRTRDGADASNVSRLPLSGPSVTESVNVPSSVAPSSRALTTVSVWTSSCADLITRRA